LTSWLLRLNRPIEQMPAGGPRESNWFSSNDPGESNQLNSLMNAKNGPSLFYSRIEGQWRLRIVRRVLPLSHQKKGETQMSHAENSERIAIASKIQTRNHQNVSQEEMRKR
jgi:hypothetical protein